MKILGRDPEIIIGFIIVSEHIHDIVLSVTVLTL